MAIGKVGAYATVEGGIVDYGKMAYGAIDDVIKDDALKAKLAQDKKDAAAKLKVEREKLKIDLDKFDPITGQGGISELVSSDLAEMADDIYNAKNAYAEGRIPISKVESMQQAYNQRIAELKVASESAKSTFSLMQKDATKIEPESLAEVSDQANALLNGNYVVSKDANGRRVYQKVEKDSTGKVTKVLQEFYSPMDIATSFKPLYKFDTAADVENFTKKEAPLSTYTDFVGLTKVESTTIEKNPKVNDAINNHVRIALSNPDNLASLYKQMSGQYKRVVTDPAEIKKTGEWYRQRLMDGYTEKVEKDRHYITPKDDDGGSNKNIFNRTPYATTESSFTYTDEKGVTGNYGKDATSQAIPVSDPTNKKQQVILSTLPILYKNGKATAKATNVLVTDMVYDKNRQLIIRGTYVTKKAKTFKATDGSVFDMSLIDETQVNNIKDASVREEVKNQLDLYSSQEGEEREIVVQPVGNAVETQILNKLISEKAVINNIPIKSLQDLRQAMGYNAGTNKNFVFDANGKLVK